MGHIILAYLHFEVSSENHQGYFFEKLILQHVSSHFSLQLVALYKAELLLFGQSVLQILAEIASTL